MTREEFIEKWGASMGHGFTDEELSADLDELFSLLPAEGAEEILDRHLYDYPWQNWSKKNALRAMYEFATLHAQRIADKMVEEKCKKCRHKGLPNSIQEALNSGDGVYRP